MPANYRPKVTSADFLIRVVHTLSIESLTLAALEKPNASMADWSEPPCQYTRDAAESGRRDRVR